MKQVDIEAVKTFRDKGTSDEDIKAFFTMRGETEENISSILQPKPFVREPEDTGMTTGQKAIHGALEYGVPMASAFTGAGIPALALISGLSTTTAAEWEERCTGESFNSLGDFIKAKGDHVLKGGMAAAFDAAGNKWMMPLLSKMGLKTQKFLTKPVRGVPGKDKMSKEVAEAQETLGKFAPQPRSTFLKDVGRKMGLKIKDEPLSLSADRLNIAQNNIVEQLGAILRGGFGSSGIMKRFDLRNQKAVSSLVNNVMESLQQNMSGKDFGDTLYRLLTKEISFIKQTRTALRNGVREQLSVQGARTNLLPMKHMLETNMGKIDQLRQVWGRASADDLLPALDADDAVWAAVPTANLTDAMRRINKAVYKGTDETIHYAANKLKTMLKPRLERSLEELSPDIAKQWELSNQYHRLYKTRFIEDKVMDSLIKQLDKTPGTVVEIFAKSPSNVKLDKLLKIKQAFTKAELPSGEPAMTTLSQKAYEKKVVEPIQHATFMQMVNEEGLVSGVAFERILKKMDFLGDEYKKEVFGKATPMYKKLATALKINESAPAGDSVMIKLVQGGQIMQVIAAGGTVLAGSQAMQGKGFGNVALASATIFLSPMALAKMMTNPTTLRVLTDGISAKAGTVAFERMFSAVASANRAAAMDMRELPSEALNFFSRTDVTNPMGEGGASGTWTEDSETPLETEPTEPQ